MNFLGYKVEWQENEEAPALFYGPRGAIYGAVRYSGDEGWCFVVDVGHRSPGVTRRLKGNAWVCIPRGSREITGAR